MEYKFSTTNALVPARIRENAVEPGAHRAGADVYVDNGHWFAREMRRLD